MSGIKAAEVRQNLQRTIKVMLALMAEAKKNDAKMAQLMQDESAESAAAADAFLAKIHQRGINGSNSKSAAQLENFFAQGQREQELAQRLRNDADKLRRQAELMAAEAEGKVRFVGERLEKFTQFMDKEDNAATTARQLAKSALKLDEQAVVLLEQIIAARKRAKDAFDTINALGEGCNFNDVNFDVNINENSTSKSSSGEKISAESEIARLMQQTADLSPEKFFPDEFKTFQAEFAALKSALPLGSPAALERCKFILEGLKIFNARLLAAQTESTCTQIAATNALTAAEQELNVFNLPEIKEYALNPGEVEAAVAELAEVKCAVKNGKFKNMSQRIEAAMKVIRAAKICSEAKKTEVEERRYVAEAIMNALYEQGYDAPTFYYSGERRDGSEDLQSELIICARAPGERGDMRMNLNLQGEITLCVDNIADGEEDFCHELIEDFQQRVEGEIDFKMTDWGRAATLVKPSATKIKMRREEQEKVREKHNE